MTNEEIKQAFEDHASKHGGQIDPRVVEAAVRADKNHPLRAVLIMSDRKAAIEQRVSTILELMRRCRVSVTVDNVTFRAPAFVAVAETERTTYEAINHARQRSHDNRREIVLNECISLRAKIQRVRSLAAALEVSDALDTIDAAVEELIGRVRTNVEDQPGGNA